MHSPNSEVFGTGRSRSVRSECLPAIERLEHRTLLAGTPLLPGGDLSPNLASFTASSTSGTLAVGQLTLHAAKKVKGSDAQSGNSGNTSDKGGDSKKGGPSKPGADGTGSSPATPSGSTTGSASGASSSTGPDASTPSVAAAATAPSVTLSAPDINSTTTSDELVTAVFSSKKNIDASKLAASALKISGPVTVSVKGVSIAKNNNRSVTAVFTIAAPSSGGWVAADNGLYTVSLPSGAVSDSGGTASAAATGSFHVNAPLPPGAIDPSFGNKQTVGVAMATEAMLSQSDGKLLLAGYTGDLGTGAAQAVIERLNSDGSVDTRFGTNGRVLTAAGANAAWYSLVLEGDGHILAAGSRKNADGNTVFLVSRYDSSGHLDTGYGQSGEVVTDFGGASAVAYAASLTGSGELIVGGVSDGQFAFAEYASNGALDAAFGQSGRQLFALSSGSDAISAIAMQPDGNIVAAGTSGTHVILMRLTAAGSADMTFGHGAILMAPGLTQQPQTGEPRHVGLAIDSSGRTLLGGRTAAGDFGVDRFDPFGNLDTTFGAAGLTTADFGGTDAADALVLGGSGQVYAIGRSLAGSTQSLAIADLDSNGNLVSDFGASGEAKVTLASNAAYAPATSEQGKLVVAVSSPATGADSATSVRRFITSSTLNAVGPTSTQSFGLVSGKTTRATFTLAGKTKVTLSLTGGSGTAWEIDGRIGMTVTSTGAGATLTVRVSGGSRRVTLDDVVVTGTLRSLSGTSANLAGTLFVSGTIGKVAFAQVSGVVAAGGGSIASLTASTFSNASILSGANLGTDDHLGGSGGDADSFAAGTIGSIRVSGTASASLISAGIAPVNGDFFDKNATAIGGAASLIRSITISRGIDAATNFSAGAFGTVRIPKKTVPATDSHFLILG